MLFERKSILFNRTALALVAVVSVSACSRVTPNAITMNERLTAAMEDKKAAFRDQTITGKLSLNEALARGIKYNRDHRAMVMEHAIATGQLDLSNLEMLPKVMSEAGYYARTNVNASNSISVITRRETLEPSTSQEKTFATGNLGLSWNILDYGLSYIQAKQNADRVLIAQERQRKAVQNLMSDIRFAFWRAAAAQVLEEKVKKALSLATTALSDAEKAGESGSINKLSNLKYQQSLLEVIKQLENVSANLRLAKGELSRLLSLKPGTDFELEVPDKLHEVVSFADMDVNKLEDAALSLRPELYEADYKLRISKLDVRKEIVRTLPGVQLTAGGYFTSNSFTYNGEWGEASVRMTWDLMDVFNYKTRKKVAESQRDLMKEQRIALSVAILSQVRLAYQQMQQTSKEYERAMQLQKVNKQIADITSASRISNLGNKLAEVRALTASIAAELTQYQTFAQLENMRGRLYASIGVDPLPADIADDSVTGLTRAIKGRMSELSSPANLKRLINNLPTLKK